MFIAGLAMTLIGLPLGIKWLLLIKELDENPFYSLSNGMSEDGLAAMTIIAFICGIVGIVLMVFGIMKRRNAAAMNSIIYTGRKNYCPHCRVNVSSNDGVCPICKNKIS